MKLKIKKLNDKAILPKYAHPGDAGMDLYSVENLELAPGERAIIATGIALQLPPETEAQVRPRSGLAIKYGITVLNTPGTIDEGYRGEIKVILINHSNKSFKVEQGMRIAQMVIQPILRVQVEEVDTIDETLRGTEGFGSTGVSG
ncbi:dUTP pyrophosphatase [Desulfitispora alkaliphila]|uniref:dUTP diphosphatase n=1 Tax=Desulfitispora alkaliphila TaxID=622674 RepID=UPI003D213B8C